MSKEVEAETEEPTEATEEPASKRKSWREFKGVVEATEIDKLERLSIFAGVNEYKGTHLVFMAKVTDKDYQRAFFGMPAYVWEKAIPMLQKYVKNIAKIEKKAMADAVLVELKRLKELGIDVAGLIEKV